MEVTEKAQSMREDVFDVYEFPRTSNEVLSCPTVKV